MARKRITAGGIAIRILIVVALAVAIYYVWQWRTQGPAARLAKVQLGDGRERVLELMGPPDNETRSFPLPADEALAADAEKVDVDTWLLWAGGMGVKCVVGLGADGTVVYKANTGT
jgi:hypothetical protein